jgi:hypothetical protein
MNITNFMCKRKDGGSESPVDAYFLIEIKDWFSIAILKFNKGGREAYHTHAFDAYTWFLKGNLVEEDVNGESYVYERSLVPKKTLKSKNHRVKALSDSWCFTIRGKWDKTWTEYNETLDETTVFSDGRVVEGKGKGVL